MFITLKVGPDYLIFCSGAPAEGLVEPRVHNKKEKRVSNAPMLCVECMRRVTRLEC